MPDYGFAFAAFGGAAEDGGFIGQPVQRAEDSARVAGWVALWGDWESHDYAGPGYYAAAGPVGEAGVDFALPGDEGSADGDGQDYAAGDGIAGSDGPAGAGGASYSVGPSGTDAASDFDGSAEGCPSGSKLIFAAHISVATIIVITHLNQGERENHHDTNCSYNLEY